MFLAPGFPGGRLLFIMVKMKYPTRTFIEQVSLPRRLHEEPESGLDHILGAALPAMAGALGAPEVLVHIGHTLNEISDLEEDTRPQAKGQSEILARQAFERNLGQPALSSGVPLVEIPVQVERKQALSPEDPAFVAAAPILARALRPGSPTASLGRRMSLSEACVKIKTGNAKEKAQAAERLPWRLRP